MSVPNFESNQLIRHPISIFSLIKEAENEKYITELEKLRKLLSELRNALPKNYKIGAAVGKGDCFFDSVAQGLNEQKIQGLITNRKHFNVKSLREDCANYANKYKDEIIKDAKVGGYFVALQDPYGPTQDSRTKENIIDNNEIFIKYVDEIKKTSEEFDNAIWGRPEIEGNIIFEKYEVNIKIIELRDEEVDGLHITTGEIGTDNNIVYLVNYRNHFVPLLNNIEENIEESKNVPREEVYGEVGMFNGNLIKLESFDAKQENQQLFFDNGQDKTRFLNQISQDPDVSLSKQRIEREKLSENDKVFKNGQLFNAIRKNKPTKEKLMKIQKHLDEGADINARDVNNKSNVPLHIAVLKGEPVIVKLLLNNGAIIDNKNADDKTPLDIAKLPDTPNGQEIVNILEAYFKSLSQPSDQQISFEQLSSVKDLEKQSQSCEQLSIQQQLEQKRINYISEGKIPNQSQFLYQKRSGTSGLSGHLYETKLLGLLLFRALNNKKIDRFYLGTNVDKIGDLDDLVFRYNLNGQEKPRVIFMQAKHRDNPDNEKVTVGGMQKKNGDFSLHKYFDSYLRIKQKFNLNSNDDIFQGKFENIDSIFVIYTPAEENCSKNKSVKQICTNKYDLLYTIDEGKILQFEFEDDDIDLLVKTASESRIKLLAKSLAKFILSDNNNYDTMMSDELIKSYHVVLAQKVIKVFNMESENYHKGKFLRTFFNNNEHLLSILRKTLYNEIVITRPKKSTFHLDEIKDLVNGILKNPSADTISKLIGSVLIFDDKNNRLKFIEKKIPQEIIQLQDGLEKMRITQEIIEKSIAIAGKEQLESLSFKLPNTFGNLNFKIRTTESKRERKLNHLTSKFIQLLKNVEVRNNIAYIKIDDNMVGSKNILENGDIKINGGIGGLVGNLLILDDETKMLKFNNDENSLPENAKQLFKKLKSKISEDKDLSSYRFEINVNGFPRLSLAGEEYEKNLVKDFLSKLKFYTNQAKEDAVETILKDEIYEHYNDNKKQNEISIRIKSDAIFLKVHDQIQKWWKQSEKTPYLTKDCKFFDQIKKDFIDSPLLTNLNFIYLKKVTKNDIKFNQDAIQALELDKFTTVPGARILYIVTNENILSSIKLIQYFKDKNLDNFTFIDLDYVLKKDCYEAIISELKETKLDTLIIGCKRHDNVKGLCEKLKNIISVFDNKIIFVIDSILDEEFKTGLPEKYIEQIDKKNSLIDLTDESQKQLLKNVKIKFQGQEISLDILINQGAMSLIDAKILSELIKNKKIKIGKTLADSKYDGVKDYYIDRTFNRQVKLKQEIFKERRSIFFFITDNSQNISQPNLQQNQDIVLISNMDEDFKKLCDNYKERNIHWLKKEGNEFIWQQSYGTLSKLREFIDEQSIKYTPKKLTDLNDKILIIAAEPGMGKSTVLTKLTENTKIFDPSLWIVRVDLLDHTNEFAKWKEGKIKIDEREAAKFLYRAMDFQAFKVNTEQTKEKKEQTINNILELVTIENDEIFLKNDGEKMIKGLVLLEIKLFNYYYNQGKITVLFDGFDEISPNYKKEVIKLLEILKDSKIERLWITTRPYNIQGELEDKLSTFSYALNPFLENDQRNFLEKFWKRNLEYNVLDLDRVNIFTEELLKEFFQSINYQEKEFISIPLHIQFIAKIFQDNFENFSRSGNHEFSHEHKQKLSEKMKLSILYKEFFRIKFDEIRFGEKTSRLDKIDPNIQEMLNNYHMSSIKKYKKLALYSLFNENDLKKLLSANKIDKMSNLIKEVEEAKLKTGIVIRVTDNKPIFVHQTFAEYFAANYLWEKFKSIELNKFKKDFIKSIIIRNLIMNDRIQICKFFQSESQMDLENNTNFFYKIDKLNLLFIALVDNIHIYGRRRNKNSEQSTKLLLKIIEFSLSKEEESNLEIIRNVQNLESNKRLALLSVSAEMGYIKLVNALEKQYNTKFLQDYLKYDKWFYSPLWLAAENGHLGIIRILVEKLSYDTTWKDTDKMILLQRIFQKDAFNVLRSCLSLDIVDSKPYEDLKCGLELPIVAAFNAHAPSDVIKLLIEKTDIDHLNKFEYFNELTPNYYISITLPKYDKEITELAIKKGIDFSKIINVMLFEFSYKSLNSPNKLRFNIIPFYNFDEKFSILFDRIELLLKSGVGYNCKDIENQTTTLQYAKRIYYVHKLLDRVHKLHYQKNDESSSPLDTILKLIIDRMSKSPLTSFKNIVISDKICLSFDYNYKSLLLFSLRYPGEISLLRDNITELLYVSYIDGNSNLVKSILDKLRSYISSYKEEIEQFKRYPNYDDYENYEEIFEFQEFNDIKQKKDRYIPLNKFVKNLLYRVLELYIKQDYKIDDALEEVLEEVAKFEKVINKLLKIKNLGYKKNMYEIDEILDILEMKSIDTNKELQDLMSKIYECGGFKLLIQTWSDLNYIGQKKIMGILERMSKFFNQSSKTFELLNKLDSSYNDLTDAIENKNYQKVNDILQNIEPDFIKTIINGQDDKYGSPLHYAAYKDDIEVIKILLTHGANPNCRLREYDKLLLNSAMRNVEDRSLRRYLELFCTHKIFYPDSNDIVYPNSASLEMFETSYIHVFTNSLPRNKVRLQKECDTSFVENRKRKTEEDEDLSRESYEKYYEGWTPLHLAVLNGHKEVVQKLICSGATFDASIDEDWKLLSIAKENGYMEIVQLLLDLKF